MRRRNSKKKNLYMILFTIVAFLGMGYAFLNATLNINGTAKINNNTWDIHFTNLVVNSNSVELSTGDSAASITQNNTSEVTYTVTLQKPGDYYEFTVDAKNFGTIDGMIETVNSKLNGVEISSSNPLPVYLDYSVTYSDDIPIDSYHLLEAGQSVTYKVHLEYKRDIDISDLPSSIQSETLSFGITSIQSDSNAIIKPEQPVIGTPTVTNNTYRSETYREKIKTVTLSDTLNPPESPVISWDIGVAQNGNVMAYLTTNADDNTMYDLYIQGDGHLYANPDSGNLFYNLTNVDSINNMNLLDTSKVTNMSYMFFYTGKNSTVFTLNLGSNFDTSNVTTMNSMFQATGHDSTVFTLDIGDKFNTSKVTNMSSMFHDIGHENPNFILNLGNRFDTSKVTTMSNMFCGVGYSSSYFVLDLGNKFDTSNVQIMDYMFAYSGNDSLTYTLNLGDKFNTSRVTNMQAMFYQAGHYSTTFTLDLGNKFDTSNVTNMSLMFESVATNDTHLTLDLGDKFNTSNVSNMERMFASTGYSNSSFELNLETFDFTNVTSYLRIFSSFQTTQKIYVKDAVAQNWIITNSGNSNLTTSNVLIKS